MTAARPHIAIIDVIGAHGGMHYYTDNQAAALVQAGHRVTVYSLPASTDAGAAYGKVQTFKRIYGEDPKAIRGLRLFRDIVRTVFLARQKGARVVLYHLFKMDRFDLLLLASARQLGMATIAIVHDVERLDQPSGGDNLAAIARNCSLMVVHNAFSEAALRRVLGDAPGRIAVIPSGNYIAQFPSPPTKSDARTQLALPQDRTIVLFFGNPRREKGLHVLLEAVVPHRDTEDLLVLVAGKMKPEEEVEHRAFVDAHGIGRRVRFDIGHVSDAVLPSYYRAADVVALPYLRIYESAVALMSMSLQRPVIASDLPPLREVVGGDRRGLLFPVGDAVALSEGIATLLRDAGHLDVLAKQAAEYAAGVRHWSVTGAMLSKAASELSSSS